MRAAFVSLLLVALTTGMAVADVKTEAISRVTMLSGIGTTEVKSVYDMMSETAGMVAAENGAGELPPPPPAPLPDPEDPPIAVDAGLEEPESAQEV